MDMVCETIGWFLLQPIWQAAMPGLAAIFYPILGYVSILTVLFGLSKLNKMPLIGVFASFAGDVLLKIWFSIGVILLVISIFCVL